MKRIKRVKNKKRVKRGVGVLISWILLVGLGVTLAVFATMWARQYAETSTTRIAKMTVGSVRCDDVSISAKYGPCEFIIKNNGYFTIRYIVLRYDGNSENIEHPENPQEGIKPDESIRYPEEPGGLCIPTGDEIELIPVIKSEKEFIGCSDKKITLSAIEVSLEYCIEQGGICCTGNEICEGGSFVNAEDCGMSCCIGGNCVTPTCSEQGGDCCDGAGICPGTTISSSDCTTCCDQPCTCSDGTPYDQCSVTKPKYCQDGTLIDDCNTCGCDTGEPCQPDGTCLAPCTDNDVDGYAIEGGDCGEVDCDDNNISINPGATEIPYDGIDQDCDGFDLADVDEDDYCKEGYSIQDSSLQCALETGLTGTDCDDNNVNVNPGAVEICTDGLDNDCDGECDYDNSAPACDHGDSNCSVAVTAIAVSDSSPIENTNINVDCTSSVANVNSIEASIDGVGICSFNTWSGNVAKFNCNVNGVGTKTVRCSVDTTKSYQSGSDQTTSITVRPSECSAYTISSNCEADTRCDWCPECSGTKYSGGSDRCVDTGTCSYYCWKDKCGATCDETQGPTTADYYYQSGTESPTGTEECYLRDYYCTADCGETYSDSLQYSCGTCCYISSSSCTGTTRGSCSYYSSGTQGPTSDSYYDSGGDSCSGTNYCVRRDWHCTGSSCAETYSDSTVATCGLCRYCGGSSCTTCSNCASCGSNKVCRSGSCDTNYVVVLLEGKYNTYCSDVCGARTCRDVGTDSAGTNDGMHWYDSGCGHSSSNYCGQHHGDDGAICSGHWTAWTNCRCSYC